MTQCLDCNQYHHDQRDEDKRPKPAHPDTQIGKP